MLDGPAIFAVGASPARAAALSSASCSGEPSGSAYGGHRVVVAGDRLRTGPCHCRPCGASTGHFEGWGRRERSTALASMPAGSHRECTRHAMFTPIQSSNSWPSPRCRFFRPGETATASGSAGGQTTAPGKGPSSGSPGGQPSTAGRSMKSPTCRHETSAGRLSPKVPSGSVSACSPSRHHPCLLRRARPMTPEPIAVLLSALEHHLYWNIIWTHERTARSFTPTSRAFNQRPHGHRSCSM